MMDILGSATNTATVTVDDQPTYRRGDYYRKELSLDNTTAPILQSVTNLAVLNNNTNADIVTNITGTVFLPKTPENFGYDADGNMTNDGRWTFTWDGENRLVSMQALGTVPSGAKKQLDFNYDYQGRRIQKIVSTWNGSAYVDQPTSIQHLRKVCGMRTTTLCRSLAELTERGLVSRTTKGYELKRALPFPVSRSTDPQGNGNGTQPPKEL